MYVCCADKQRPAFSGIFGSFQLPQTNHQSTRMTTITATRPTPVSW